MATEVFGIDLFNDKNNFVVDKLIARAEEITLPDFDVYVFDELRKSVGRVK